MRKQVSLRRRLLFMVVAFWMLPVISIYAFMTLSYRKDIIEKTTVLMEESLKNFTFFNAQRIEEAIDASKNTSYEQIIEKAWKKYQMGYFTKTELYREITGNLTSKFYNNNRFEIAVFYLTEEPDRIYYTRQKQNNYIDIYKTEVAKEAQLISGQNTSDAQVRIINGRIYVIRNLYTLRNYTKFGTLVLELDKDKLVDGISLNQNYELAFFINNNESLISYDKQLLEEEQRNILNKVSACYSTKVNRKVMRVEGQIYTGLIYQQKFNDFHFGGILVADENVMYSELKRLYMVMLTIMLVSIPIFIYMLYFVSHHITRPMSRMIDAAKTLEKGDIGMQIGGEPMPNKEFDVLQVSFNQMSSEIKYLFDYAYSEKLARKDAKILALQSQINPHFLNNTLEMMNWQARMAGDITVSKMIEALGTLLNYSMDRSNRKMINLAEELRCVDAYCYIISMRFGKRLMIEKEVDNTMLQIQVPQLILQPLIENAVVHGVETVKSGTIRIKVFHDEENAFLQIINSGKDMTREDQERIQRILDGSQNPEEKEKHESLGIYNVNERIKLIYGEEYGLTIRPIGPGETASTITLPLEYDPNKAVTKTPNLIWTKSKK
ncbi:MAG TPA: histidine kinase [Clostridiales bacterium]|nr:histidine kinase [Clostridiales bacterium]